MSVLGHARRRPSPKVTTVAAVRAAIAATRWSAALSTAMPVGRQRLDQLALARATSSIVPNTSVCTAATRVTMPTVGRAIAHSSAMWPTPAGAHLHHDGLGAVGRVEQRERHAQLVVERPRAGRGRPAARRGRRRAGPSPTSCRPNPVIADDAARAAGDRASAPGRLQRGDRVVDHDRGAALEPAAR